MENPLITDLDPGLQAEGEGGGERVLDATCAGLSFLPVPLPFLRAWRPRHPGLPAAGLLSQFRLNEAPQRELCNLNSWKLQNKAQSGCEGHVFRLVLGSSLEGGAGRREKGRKDRQNAHYTQACQFPFYISLSVFVTELLINRKRLLEGMKQVQEDQEFWVVCGGWVAWPNGLGNPRSQVLCLGI